MTDQWSNIQIVEEEPFSIYLVISVNQVDMHIQYVPTIRHNLLNQRRTQKLTAGFFVSVKGLFILKLRLLLVIGAPQLILLMKNDIYLYNICVPPIL